MTNIDDSTQTPPGYWFGVIEQRLTERMRGALAESGLRRGGWRILHTLADGPASAEELAARLPQHGGRPHDERGHGFARGGFARGYGHGVHPGLRGQEPRDEGAAAQEGGHPHPDADQHPDAAEHPHDGERADHGHHDHFERAFERGYLRGFDRGFAFGAVRGTPAPGGFPGGGFRGGFPGYGNGPFGAGRPTHPCAEHRHPGTDRGGRRTHRVNRILSDFVERGWVWFDGERATLTEEGRAAHDRAFERVQTVRAELANGIAEGDYAVTLATLETMARNLGWRPAGHDESGSGGAPSMDA
ncbi:hypothetical protein [Leifsonia sp. LS-T14]|uniref:hypothetical protein n=1 Tax=unclassified Leifsonia TaxID=2663824 RepID=UPI0035A65DFE